LAKQVAVAMSGGVDSSVAAYLLKKDGHRPVGVNLKLWEDKRAPYQNEAIEGARRVANQLEIPFYCFDFSSNFQQEVIDYFCQEYLKGRTPNPCIVCNQKIKFGRLLEAVEKLGIHLLATGHYATVKYNREKHRYLLKKGEDSEKDQSYFLFSLTQRQLSQTLFPLARWTKERTRVLARELSFPNWDREESQEICFIPGNDYNLFLKGRLPELIKPGPILTKKDKVIGRHPGIAFFTVGQRRGLGIGSDKPLYVVSIDRQRNALVVAEREQTYARGLTASHLNWLAWERLDKAITCKAKIRSQHKPAEVVVHPRNGERVTVLFDSPQKAPTPGQAIVFYRENLVLGGGWIDKCILRDLPL